MSLNDLVEHYAIDRESKGQGERIADRIYELAEDVQLPDLNFRAKDASTFQWTAIAKLADFLARHSNVFRELREDVCYSN